MNTKEAIERLKLCANNECNICGRYEKEECMLERNRCEKTLLNELKHKTKENKQLIHKIKTYKGMLQKQNKIINEMAKEIYLKEPLKYNNAQEVREHYEKEQRVNKNALYF